MVVSPIVTWCISMKYCARCNRRYKDKEGFCSSCGIELLAIPKPQRQEKTQKQKDQSTYLGVLVIVFIFLLLVGAYVGIQSEQSTNNIILQQQVLQNQKVNVKVLVDNDNNEFWLLYIDGMSTGHNGDSDNIYVNVQVTKENHKFELQGGDGVIFDSITVNIVGGEEIPLTIS